MLLIVRQILLVSTLKNVLRTVWRICILTLGCKGLKNQDGRDLIKIIAN